MLDLLERPHLLNTESLEDFNALHNKLTEDIGPRNSVERIYVADIANVTWEILRWRRCKTTLIGMAFESSIVRLLTSRRFEDAEEFARDWFTDNEAKKEVLELLAKVGLDEFAIEAEAIRSSTSDLEKIDRMLASCEANRRRSFRAMEDYRAGFAKVVRASSDRAVERNRAPMLEIAPNK